MRPHRIRGLVAGALLDRGAIAPGRAVRYAPDDREAQRELARLRDAGVVKTAPDGRIWFDLRCHYAAQAHREGLRAAIGAGVAIVLAVATVVLFYRG